jgi:hypothetical protein
MGMAGVKGYSTNSHGVDGVSTSSYGVYGYSGSDWDFYAGGDTHYGSASSIRWKNNIKPINNALEKVIKLRGVYFNWDKEHGGKYDMGMVAEEVGEVVPEVVSYEKDSEYATGMDYGKLTSILIEAIKEQQKQIEDFKDQIEDLRKQINEIRGR